MNQTMSDLERVYLKKYDAVVVSMNVLSVIFLIAGIFAPIFLLDEIGTSAIERKPEVLIFPIYLGFILLVFSALSYGISSILVKPAKKSQWLENALMSCGVVLLFIGAFVFLLMISKTENSFGPATAFGIKGGIVLLLVHLQLGLMCMGVSSIHNKYRAPAEVKPGDGTSGALFCTNCGKKYSSDSVGSFCQECGNKL
jgi:hypothetical protein